MVTKPDTTIYDKQKTLLDQKNLQAAFEARKIQEALQSQALIQQVTGALTPKDQFLLQMQQQQFDAARQDKANDLALRQADLSIKQNEQVRKAGPNLMGGGGQVAPQTLPMLTPQSFNTPFQGIPAIQGASLPAMPANEQGFNNPPAAAALPPQASLTAIPDMVDEGGFALEAPISGVPAAQPVSQPTNPAIDFIRDQQGGFITETANGKLPKGMAYARGPDGQPYAAPIPTGTATPKKQFDDTLKTIQGLYDELGKLGAVTTPTQGKLANAVDRLGNSYVGQAIGSAASTEEQTLRDQIEAAKSLAASQYIQAAGLSSGQTNSVSEQERFLKTLGSLGNSYEANQKILENVSKSYGTGSVKAKGSKELTDLQKAFNEKKDKASAISIIKSPDSEYFRSLPKGAQFRTPDGQLRVKK